MKSLWIIGSGGHARVVIDTVRAGGTYEVAGILDDNPLVQGNEVAGVMVRGSATPDSLHKFKVERAVIAIGDNSVRQLITVRLADLVEWVSVIHPLAYVAELSSIGSGSVVFAGAIVQTGSRIGRHVILNTNCSVDHDGLVENYAHIAPGATLAGSVSVGEGTFVGLRAGIIPGIQVGNWSVIGAGAMVVQDVPEGVTVVGVPARPIH